MRRRQHVRIAAGRQGIDHNAECWNRQPSAEQVGRSVDVRAANAKRQPLEVVRGRQQNGCQRVEPTVDQRISATSDVGRGARVVVDVELIGMVDGNVENDRLDEDLASRSIEPVDDGANRRVVAQGRGDDQ